MVQSIRFADDPYHGLS